MIGRLRGRPSRAVGLWPENQDPYGPKNVVLPSGGLSATCASVLCATEMMTRGVDQGLRDSEAVAASGTSMEGVIDVMTNDTPMALFAPKTFCFGSMAERQMLRNSVNWIRGADSSDLGFPMGPRHFIHQ